MKTTKNQENSSINFKAKLTKIGSWSILRLPQSASETLPSRGMVIVEGTINGTPFRAPLEPDGKKGHWFKVDETMLKAVRAHAGGTVELIIEPTKEWPEPTIPADLKEALEADPKVHVLWMDITPMARWDWIRWIQSTKNPETRTRRIKVTLSKFKAGKRRPCCFNRTECTIPYVSNKGVLLEPTGNL